MTETTLARGAHGAQSRHFLDRLPARPAHVLAWALEHRFLLALGLFVAVALDPLADGVLVHGQTWTLVALVAVPLAIVLRGRPRLAALALVAAGIVLRFGVDGAWNGDQVATTVAAAQAVLNGENPYGRGYVESWPPGAPFPYGPLALVWGLPGQIVEFAASIATMILFIATGSWLALAFYAGDSSSVYAATQGINDLSPGLLIAVGFLLLRKRPFLGGLVLAMAAAIKPYTFAWFPAAIGYAGLPALLGLVAGSLVLWSPLLVWGLGSFLRSVEMARAVHPIPNALNMPELRVLGIPLAIAGLWVRRWEIAIAAGTAVFIVVLFFDRWASKGYWLAVIPIAAIALEEWAVRRASEFVRSQRRPAPARNRATAQSGAAVQPLAPPAFLRQRWAEQPIIDYGEPARLSRDGPPRSPREP